MATSPEQPTNVSREPSVFDNVATKSGQLVFPVLLGLGGALALTVVVLAIMYGMRFLILDLWLGALAVILIGAALVHRWASYEIRDLAGGDVLRLLALTVAGLAGFFTALLGPVLAIWQYSNVFSGGVETWRQNTGTIVLCALPLFGGLILMFVGLLLGMSFERSRPNLRRLLYGYNAVLGSLLLFAVLGLINLLSYTHVKPFSGLGATLDWTSGGIYTLQEGSQTVLASMKEPVEVYVILQRVDPITPDVELLLENCRAVNPQIRWQVVSPDTDETVLNKLSNYQIPGPGLLIVSGAPGSEVNEFVKREDLVTSSFDPKGGSSETFQGEYALIKTLSYLEGGKTQSNVYFTQGNGELDYRDNSAGARAAGLGQLVGQLSKGNYKLFPLPLDKKSAMNEQGQAIDLPKDADIVVIAGPHKTFAPEAVQALRNYLKPPPGRKPGKLVVLLDMAVVDGKMEKTGLEDLLAEYGVAAGNNRILSAMLQNPRQVLVEAKGGSPNPIAKAFSGNRAKRFVMVDARTVQPAPPSPGRNYMVEVLLEASTQYGIWAEENLGADVEEMRGELLQDREKLVKKIAKDPLPVAVAVSESNLPPGHPGLGAGGGQQKPVMVVFGDATWVSNREINRGSNFNLFTSCLAWLRERPEIGQMPSPPKRPTYEFNATEDGFYRMLFLPGSLMLLAVISLSLGVWLVRRR